MFAACLLAALLATWSQATCDQKKGIAIWVFFDDTGLDRWWHGDLDSDGGMGISELLKRPHIFDKATAELDRVIGRERWVNERDIDKLPYIEAIVKETMRLHPVVPMLIPRFSREDCTISGYDIPAGTLVLVNVWTIGRDPGIWDCPDEFRPERFMGSSIDVKGHDFELLPFGSGRRMCPGYKLGLKVIQTSLANLLHGFSWRLPEGMTKEELSMEEIFGLSTPRKFPLEVVVEPKLPAHFYGV